MNRAEALHRTILQCEVGSSAHGLNLESGDRDEMGVMVETLDDHVNLKGQPFAEYIYRDAEEREGFKGAKSQAGDLDLTVYSLRKFAKLALQGNPTILTCFFAPVVYGTADGSSLRGIASSFASKEAGRRFKGYLHNQRERLLGQRGQKDVNRPELVSKYGFDTKYCMHMLRLGIQGIEYLSTGVLQLPMRESDRTALLAVRQGKFSQDYCIEWCKDLESALDRAIETSPLPDKPDVARVQAWVTATYLKHWHHDSVKETYPEHEHKLKNTKYS